MDRPSIRSVVNRIETREAYEVPELHGSPNRRQFQRPVLPSLSSSSRSERESSPSNTSSNSSKRKPCGACKERRRRCDYSCAFADVIQHDESHMYSALCEMYNIKWVEEVLSNHSSHLFRRFFVEKLLNKDGKFFRSLEKCFPEYFIGYGDVSGGPGGRTKRRSEPCGACKEKKRVCNSSCVFAGAIPYEEPEKYRKLNKMFNIKWVEKILLPLKGDLRVEVVNLFLSEADRLKEFSYSLSPGCGNHTLPSLASPPQDVGQHNFSLIDNLLPFNQHDQLESWGGILLS